MSKKREKQRGDHVESAASPPSVVAEPTGDGLETEADDTEPGALPQAERAQSAVELLTVEAAAPTSESSPSPSNASARAAVATSTADGAHADSTPSAQPPSAPAATASDAPALTTTVVDAGATASPATDSVLAPQNDVDIATTTPASGEESRSRWGFASRALKAAKKLLLVDEAPTTSPTALEPTSTGSPSNEATTPLDDTRAGGASEHVDANASETTAKVSANSESTTNDTLAASRVDTQTPPHATSSTPSASVEMHATSTVASAAVAQAAAPGEHAVAVSADASADAKPAFCGHSSVLAVPEVLGLLATLHKSGSFSVWNGHDAFRIRLVRGTVVSAQATASAHQLLLGTILVDHGAIAAQTLAEFMAQLAPGQRLGDALVEAGLIERTTLESAVQFQAQRVFHAAYGLRDAWYRFDIDVDDSVHERGMSVTHLLLESARMRDETEQRLDDVLGDPFPDGTR